jgi:hypothetical protein
MRRRLPVVAAVLASIVLNGVVPGGAIARAADEAPAAPPAAPAEHQVELLAEEPNLIYWIDDNRSQPANGEQKKKTLTLSATSLRMLCTVPCAAPLGPGTFALGISRSGGQLVTVPPITLRGDEVLKASYHSRWAMRLAFFVGGLLTAAIGGVVAFQGDPSGKRQALGAGILTVGVVGMATPLFIDDKATIVPVPR